MSGVAQLLIFHLDDRKYALPLDVVERVFRAVEVTPLPDAPPIVIGAINVHGHVLPVLNLRRRFLMTERAIGPDHWLVVARVGRHTVALPVDGSDGVLEWPAADVVASATIAPGLELFPGVVRLSDALILVHDVDRFLSFDEAQALDGALHTPPDRSRQSSVDCRPSTL